VTEPKRTGTLADLAALPGMPSQPSLQRFIASRLDFPVLQRGRNGVAYEFDLDAAAAFVAAHWRDGRRREGDALCQPDMFGSDVGGDKPSAAEAQSFAHIDTFRALHRRLGDLGKAKGVQPIDLAVSSMYATHDLAMRAGMDAHAAIEWIRTAADTMESQVLAGSFGR
jgi:hypothetical protein